MKQRYVKIKNVVLGNDLPLVLIGGPDSLESEKHALFMASSIKKICDGLKIQYIFKASYDKANRTSSGSFRGLGLKKGMEIFKKIQKELKIPVTTDVHSPEETRAVAKVVDLIQIPALLSRQTDLIAAAAKTGKPVNVKKGQFMSPFDVSGIIGKVESAGSKKLLLTERGYMFGYQNLVVDMRSLEIMKQSGYPVVFDASHSVQLPSAGGEVSAGEKQFIFPLTRAAAAVGVAGIFVEVHDNPDKAPVDGKNSLDLKDLKKVLSVLKNVDKLVKQEL